MRRMNRLKQFKNLMAIFLCILIIFNLSITAMAKGKPYVEKKSAPVTAKITQDQEAVDSSDTAAIEDEETARASGIYSEGFNHLWLFLFVLIAICLKKSLDTLQESNE